MSEVKNHADVCIDLRDIPVDKAELFESWLERLIKDSVWAEYFEYMELNY